MRDSSTPQGFWCLIQTITAERIYAQQIKIRLNLKALPLEVRRFSFSNSSLQSAFIIIFYFFKITTSQRFYKHLQNFDILF